MSGTTAVASTTIESAKYNSTIDDLVTDANTARPVVAGGTGATSASGARTALGVAIGTDVQAYDAGLASIAGLTTAADKMVYTTALDTYAVADLTTAGRALLDDADASAQRTTLGLGTAAQASTGTTSGTIPLLGTGGKLDSDFIPRDEIVVTGWTTDSPFTEAHGLGARPQRVEGMLRCISANNGWAVGDTTNAAGGYANVTRGLHIVWNATTIYGYADSIYIMDLAGSALVLVTPAQWDIVFLVIP